MTTTPTVAEAQAGLRAVADALEEARNHERRLERAQAGDARGQDLLDRQRAALEEHIAMLQQEHARAFDVAVAAHAANTAQNLAALERIGRIRQRLNRYEKHLKTTPEAQWPEEDWYEHDRT